MGLRIALAGNPNCGKTTMFNDLTGSSQYVGNWPGVTVEKKEGKLKGHRDVIITDLPGVYSLSPYTLEEVVTRDYLLNEKPDAVINLVDGTNLERNLYLTTQLLELGIPAVIALNMMDLVNRNGDKIDTEKLSKALGCEIVETSALKGTGSMEVAKTGINLGQSRKGHTARHRFSTQVEEALEQISVVIQGVVEAEHLRWYAIKCFERDKKVIASLQLPSDVEDRLEAIITATEKIMEDDSESIITNERYEYISGVMNNCVKKKLRRVTTSDQIDRIVTNRVLALPIFIVIMGFVYFMSVTWIGGMATDWTNDVLFGTLIQPGVQTFLTNVGASAWLNGLIVDGIINGVGSVLGFVPQMFVLFFFLSILEDCGYMARVAFIMDRIFRKFGLSGKSFIPMLISSGCGVPGIMSSKTIENEKDRRMTIITTTFVPCGAKLPIIALIAGAIMGGAWWMAPAMYFMGILAVIVSGIILKKTRMFAGEPAPFIMELPRYHVPAAKGVLIHMWERCRAFIVKAGTVIFIACAVIWFLSSFGFTAGHFGMVDDEDGSMLAAIGHAIQWLFVPLGFHNWKEVVASISGLIAKENVVGTIGVLNGMGGDASETDPNLWASAFHMFSSQAAAVSFLVFNLLCAPCCAAIGAVKREMASTKWTWFAVLYQTGLAYTISMIVFQLGNWFTGGGFGFGAIISILLVILYGYLIFRPAPTENRQKKLETTGDGKIKPTAI